MAVAFLATREHDILYRHTNSFAGEIDKIPQLVVAREDGERIGRLLSSGHPLWADINIPNRIGGAFKAANVIGEVKGSEKPDEFVILGAHLDSWELGTGALDNGCNAALVLDLARQMKTLGLRPRRTVRFALWNGEEQGLEGSFGYVKTHAAELDRHVATLTLDIGSGRVSGFFTGGRPELGGFLDRALKPVAGLGPFVNVPDPVVGTDNYDFMMEGVANLVANQESANYGPNYHARSDTFDKVDQRQLRLNAAVAAAVVWALAQDEASFPRQSRAQVEALVEGTTLKEQMKSFGLWESWTDGSRGRKR